MVVRVITTAILSASVVGLVATISVPNASAASYFKDRTVTIVVPSGSGGTFHIYCQLVVRHLGRHIPDRPKLIIQNRPGAGGVKSLRYMTTVAPKDGSMIAMINPGTTMTPVLRPNIGYDTRDLQWLGAVSVRTYTLGVWHTVPITTIADAKNMEVTLASTGRTATSTTLPHFFNYLLGTKFKVIHGYKGGGAMNLAVERGEVMGRTNYYSGYLGVRPHWLREKKIRFLATIGPPRAEVADVPRMRDLVKPGMDREMLDLLEQNFNVGQAFYVPPGVPKERVALLRKSFGAMLKDPAMIAEAKKRGVPTFTRSWQQVEKAVQIGFNSRKEVQEKLATSSVFEKRSSKHWLDRPAISGRLFQGRPHRSQIGTRRQIMSETINSKQRQEAADRLMIHLLQKGRPAPYKEKLIGVFADPATGKMQAASTPVPGKGEFGLLGQLVLRLETWIRRLSHAQPPQHSDSRIQDGTATTTPVA